MPVGKIPDDNYRLWDEKKWNNLTNQERAQLNIESCFAMQAIFNHEKEHLSLIKLARGCILVIRVDSNTGTTMRMEQKNKVFQLFKETVIKISEEMKKILNGQKKNLWKIEEQDFRNVLKIIEIAVSHAKVVKFEELAITEQNFCKIGKMSYQFRHKND